MRILYVADSFDIGGAERVMISDAIGLKAMGHDVTVACSSGGLLAKRPWPAASKPLSVVPAQ